MARKKWVRLDNASNMFLAAMKDRDPKVFRLTAEMAEEVNPTLLQKALDKTYEEYVLYHSVLRRGVFWYYLEMSDLHPEVMKENISPCSQLYHFDRRNLLFRVMYYNKRIHVEFFHALADGTGASWFFEDVIKEYIIRKHPEQLEETDHGKTKSVQQLEDSFNFHFKEEKNHLFRESARSAIQSLVKTSKRAGKLAVEIGKKTPDYMFPTVENEKKRKRVYQVKGTRTPDNRPRIVELTVPVKDCLPLARKENVSLTIYMTALFFESVRKASPSFKSGDTISVSVPVNLRQFFPSESARNFFSTTHLEYTYGKPNETFTDICQELNEQFQKQLNPEKLEKRLRKLIAFEYNPFLRIVPRPLKDAVLKGINWKNNQNLTLAISNLGRMFFPEDMKESIKKVFFQTSVVRPQFCMISYENELTITFSSPFIETDIQKEFLRSLTNQDIQATVSVNQVTHDEMRGE